MSVVSKILYTYRSPSKVFALMYQQPVNEAKSLGYLMGACLLLYVSRWPYLARQAHLEGSDLQLNLAGSLVALLLLAPLLFYILALLLYGLHRIFSGNKSSGQVRMGFFWALFATSPIIMLVGLVQGFLEKGIPLQVTEVIWCLVLAYFIICALICATEKVST